MEQPQITTTQYQGNEGEDPTNPFWTSGNYVGPYWSDGKVQESVEWGSKPALHALDELARQHDAAYARYKDAKHREAADMIFAEEAKKLKTKYGSNWASDPQIAARLVEYGNHTARQLTKLARDVPKFGLGALIYHGVSGIIDNHKRIQGTYLKTEQEALRKFYSTDPMRPMPNAVGKQMTAAMPKDGVLNGKTNRGWDSVTPGQLEVAATRNKFATEKSPLSEMTPEQRNVVISGQAKRFRKHRKTYADAIASAGQKAAGYVKRKLNMDKAKPKKKKKNKVVAC